MKNLIIILLFILFNTTTLFSQTYIIEDFKTEYKSDNNYTTFNLVYNDSIRINVILFENFIIIEDKNKGYSFKWYDNWIIDFYEKRKE